MLPGNMATAVIQFLLRLPPDLHAQLKDVAAREERSLNAQIVYALKQWLKLQNDE